MRTLKILVTPHGEVLAHTTRALMVAEELRNRGANVTFAMRGDKSEIVKAAGFSVRDIVDVPLRDILRRHRKGNAKLCDDSQAAECIDADLRILSDEKPDIVLSDFRLSMPASARIAKIPHVAILNSTWTPYLDQQEVRIVWPEHTRVGAAFGKLARFLAGPDLMRFRFLDPLFRFPFEKNLAHGATPFNKIQTPHGVAPSRDLYHYWLGDLTLVPDYPVFMPIRRDAPASIRMIGPLVWQGANFFEIEKLESTLDRTRPIIYVTVGSTGDPGIFQLMIDAANRKKWNLIITKAGLADIPSSRNIFVYDLLPGEAAMRLSDVTICQGGSGTINQAIAADCPFVGIASTSDQEWNLDRAFRLGIAKVFYQANVEPEKIVMAVEEILSRRDAYRARFSVFADDKRNYLGARTAVDAIESGIEDRTLKIRSS